MNLNIEGTKHEKAVLVILSYISGFTAGFIVFALANTSAVQSPAIVMIPDEPVMQIETPQTAPTEESVITPTESSLEASNADEGVQALYKDGRLMASANGASILLSAQLDTVDKETAKLFSDQGVHTAIPKFATSDDGSYIYYCEQHSDADLCTNFIYDVANQVIQYVTVDDVKLVTPSALAESALWQEGKLSIGSAISVSSENPWKLTEGN